MIVSRESSARSDSLIAFNPLLSASVPSPSHSASFLPTVQPLPSHLPRNILFLTVTVRSVFVLLRWLTRIGLFRIARWARCLPISVIKIPVVKAIAAIVAVCHVVKCDGFVAFAAGRQCTLSVGGPVLLVVAVAVAVIVVVGSVIVIA